jgi:hypothetical protein
MLDPITPDMLCKILEAVLKREDDKHGGRGRRAASSERAPAPTPSAERDPDEHHSRKSLMAYVANVIEEQLHDLDRRRVVAVLAATLTGMQYCNREVEGSLAHIVVPFFFRPAFESSQQRTLGHPRPYQKDWRDLAVDIRAEFWKAMGPGFDNKAAAARFVHAVIPLITGETPDLTAVEQYLKQPRTRKSRRPFVRRGARHSF